MEIDPDDPKLIPFYQKMVELHLPLLSHTGEEKSFSRADEDLGDPDKLRLPLSLGVTVIAAHIASSETYHGERGPDRLAASDARIPQPLHGYFRADANQQARRVERSRDPPGIFRPPALWHGFSAHQHRARLAVVFVSPFAPPEMVHLAHRQCLGPGRADQARPRRAHRRLRPPAAC